jgi:pSer/pThr/pTyr-binding forkhead associated (FHA) protein
MLIGRHPDCDVRIESPRISRRHCCLALAYDRFILRDLGSRHGVRVNGEVISECEVRVGDEIAVGPVLFRLVDPLVPLPPPRMALAAKPPKRPKPPSIPEIDHPQGDIVPLSELVPDL